MKSWYLIVPGHGVFGASGAGREEGDFEERVLRL